jgi:hypothetical protein
MEVITALKIIIQALEWTRLIGRHYTICQPSIWTVILPRNYICISSAPIYLLWHAYLQRFAFVLTVIIAANSSPPNLLLLAKMVLFWTHRYLRKVDCLTHISLWNIHFNKKGACSGHKKEGLKRLGSPNCPLGLGPML